MGVNATCKNGWFPTEKDQNSWFLDIQCLVRSSYDQAGIALGSLRVSKLFLNPPDDSGFIIPCKKGDLEDGWTHSWNALPAW